MQIVFKKNIANLISIINLLLGFVAIVLMSLSFLNLNSQENLKTACLLIFLAAIVDVFDGKIARKLDIAGDFGKEIDSLADLVSFCLAPSLLIFTYYYDLINLNIYILIILSSLPLVCGAIRLADFNSNVEKTKFSYYLGLPTPSNALFICSSILFMFNMDFLMLDTDIESLLFFLNNNSNEFFIFTIMKYPFSYLLGLSSYSIIALCSFTSFLLISKIRFSKFPVLNYQILVTNLWKLVFFIFFIIISILSIIYNQHNILILFFISYYIISGVINSLYLNFKGHLL